MNTSLTQSNKATNDFRGQRGLQLIPHGLFVYSFIATQTDPTGGLGFILRLAGLGLYIAGVFLLRNYYQEIFNLKNAPLPSHSPPSLRNGIIAIFALLIIAFGIGGLAIYFSIERVTLHRLMGLFLGLLWLTIGWLPTKKKLSYALPGLLLLIISVDLFNWFVSDRFIEYGGVFFVWGLGTIFIGIAEHQNLVRSADILAGNEVRKIKIRAIFLLAISIIYVGIVGSYFLRFAVFAPYLTQVAQLSLINKKGEAQLDWSHDMTVNGHFAYLVQSDGLYTIDITNPAMPALYSFQTLSVGGEIVQIGKNSVYTHDGIDHLAITDVSNPSSPILASESTYPAHTIVLSNELLYLVDKESIFILDVHDPYQPALLNQLQITTPIDQFWINGRFAYAITSTQVILLDLSDPLNPQERDRYSVEANDNYPTIRTTAVEGEVVYVAATDERLHILQAIQDKLIHLKTFTLPDPLIDLVAQDHRLYGLNYDALHLFDVSNPKLPYRVGWYDLSFGTRQLAIVGNQLYVTNEKQGFLVYQLES